MGIAFVLIALAEFGDKTQLMTISLASKYRRTPVFWGVLLGMSAVTVIGVAVGTLLYSYVPITPLKIIAAALFILFGLYTLLSEENEDEVTIKDSRVFRDSFVLSTVAEFGDKTQLAVIGLTARYAAPIPVLIGAVLGLALIVGIGVLLGEQISLLFERKKIELGAAILFIALGVVFLVEALL